MNPAMSIAVSGLQAAAKRVAISADNVVNMRSRSLAPGTTAAEDPSAFRAMRAYQQALGTGGTSVTTRPVTPASIPVYNSSGSLQGNGGIEYRPNVSLEYETMEQITAKRAYEASAKLISTVDDMTKTLLDSIK